MPLREVVGVSDGHEQEPTERLCRCPYCESTGEEPLPFCSVCGKEVARCPNCKELIETEDETCPRCGFDILGEDTEK